MMVELTSIFALYLAPIALAIAGCYLIQVPGNHPLPKIVAMFMLISSIILFMGIAGEAAKTACSLPI